MFRTLSNWLLFVALFTVSFRAYAHEEDPVNIRFIENKGQWEPQVHYSANLPSGKMFLESDRIRFVFSDLSNLHDQYFASDEKGEPVPFTIDCHSFDLTFPGSNPTISLTGSDGDNDYYNYFQGNDPQKWGANARPFHTVTYHDLYPGIDLVIRAAGESLKYEFIVAPGADAGKIQMAYEGLESISLREGALNLTTTINSIIDSPPFSFQVDSSDVVATEYRLQGNTVNFAFPNNYDTSRPLTIDPTLVFSTYTGSLIDNFGFSATYDDAGNLYAGGTAFGTGYPVTQGAYQISYGGGGGTGSFNFDISISKFSPTGAHLWSSYLGGSNRDQPHSMITNSRGDLFIYGRTLSSDYPVTQNAYDPLPNGNYDIVVSRLSSNGSNLQGSSYVGGSGIDGSNSGGAFGSPNLQYNYGDDARGEIVLDDQDNVYVASCTQSLDFPTTNGVFQANLRGRMDGCLFKMSPFLTSLTWSTYIGGSSDDAAYSLKVDAQDQVFLTGGTMSADFPTTSGTLNPTYQGGIDGFIVRINNNGNALVSGTFIGNSSYNQCYFIELDRDEDVYVVGQKLGTWPVFPAGTWSTPGGGGQFIMKLDNDLSTIVYSTEFGTSNNLVNISPTAFLVDVCEFVYVSGWGGITNGQAGAGNTFNLPTSPNAYQSTTDGSDLYILVLQPDAIGIEYATFIGGNSSNEHVDGGTSRFNKRAEIYQSVCAGCGGNSDFPTTPGAFSSTNNSFNCNLACFKLSLDLPGVVADFYPDPDTIGCAPQTITFNNLSAGGNTYEWNFGDGNTSTAFSPTHTYPNAGTYSVQLIATDSNTCNVVDTAYRTIVVAPVPIAQVSPDTAICEGESIQLFASGGQSYQWLPALYLNNPVSSSPVSTPTADITYSVIATSVAGCSDTTTVTVTLHPNPQALATGDTLICPGDSVSISASGGAFYQWSPATGLADPGLSTTNASPGASTQYIVTVTSNDGCTDSDTVQLDVSTINANAGPDIDLCVGDSVQITGSGGQTYSWFPPSFLSNPNISNPMATPGSDIAYTLTVRDAIGCEDVDSMEITIRPLPNVDAGPDTLICDNDAITLNASGALQYNWSPATFLSNPNLGNPVATPSQDIQYFLVGTDQYGCENFDSMSISVIPAPIAMAFADATICEDSSIQLNATGGVTYLWTPAAPLNNPAAPDPIATLNTSTQFILTAFSGNGCDDQDTIDIMVTPTPQPVILGPDVICLGEGTVLDVSGVDNFDWSDGTFPVPRSVSPDSTTIYGGVGYVAGCPSEPVFYTLTVDRDLPTAAFTVDVDSGWVPQPVQFTNLSSNAVDFQWIFGDGGNSQEFEPNYIYNDTGRFIAQHIAINANGCADTAQLRIIVGADFTIYIPNAFTPNGDGVNDFFSTPYFRVQEFHIMLFDRWGMMIYESFDPNFQWDGFYKNKEVPEGVYTYVIEASGYIGEKIRRAGTVTLYR